MDFKEFLNSNLLSTIVTLLVGSVAIFLYWKRKIDQKRDAAGLILQEIRYAETQIRTYRETPAGGYPLAIKLLPTNSWHQNIHLFVRELGETDTDLISKFYSKVNFIDVLIAQIATKAMNGITIITTPPPEGTQEPPAAPAQIQIGGQAQAILDQVSQGIEFIYNTPVVEKLRKIARKRHFYFF